MYKKVTLMYGKKCHNYLYKKNRYGLRTILDNLIAFAHHLYKRTLFAY